MTQRNRKTLTKNFADGSLPTEEAFGDLIDSMVNILDDGLEKTPRDGLKIAQMDKDYKLLTFYDTITVKDPLWSVAFSMPAIGGEAGGGQNLNFFYGANNATGLTLAKTSESDTRDENPGESLIRIGVNNNNPEHAIDAEGVVASNGRIGREGGEEKKEVLADGTWYPIVTGLEGCHAFEVMAGVGKPGSGRYALLHAFALSTFNSKKGNITSHQAYYSSKCDRIELRWSGSAQDYSLEMRTSCSYMKKAAKNDEKGGEIRVRFYITRLWFDPLMDGSFKKQPRAKKDSGAARPDSNQDSTPEETARPAQAAKPRREKLSVMDKFKNMLKSIGR